jgi:hypothetical protein
VLVGVLGQEGLEFALDGPLYGVLRDPFDQAGCLDILQGLKRQFLFHDIILHILVFVFIVVVTAASWLGCKVEITFVIFILEECCWHPSLAGKFSIPAIEACFKTSSLGNIKITIVALIINVSIIVAIILSRLVITLKIVCEEVNSIFVFSHLVGIVNIESKLNIFLNIVVIIASMLDGIGRRGRSDIASRRRCTGIVIFRLS